MKFYLPNFEDLVDPDYDFIGDHYSPQRKVRGRFEHDWYAHQFFEESIFDGMLLSRTVISQTIKTRILQAGGVHAFCRLPSNVPIMGDCGAFSYVKEANPPYSVTDTLNYYESLGFSSGVALDHLIFPSMTLSERERRFTLTLDNARDFLTLHRSSGYTFEPIGIIQGWDPPSRCAGAEQLVQMGYKSLALGGMARSSDRDLRTTLEAIHVAIPPSSSLHIFGVARLSMIADFVRFGVTSVDSASPMRRAFLGTSADNYWTIDGPRYAAIRVPQTIEGASRKRGVNSTEEVLDSSGVDLEALKQMEQEALSLLRQYDRSEVDLEHTLHAILIYDKMHGDQRNHEEAYRRVLEDKPWQACNCSICQQCGVEVILFRGNNRNRRRGFHNVRVFYERFRKEVSKARPLSSAQETNSEQLTLRF